MYTALVLTESSQTKLKNYFQGLIPPDWQVICHHVTISMGDFDKSPAAQDERFKIGSRFGITVINYAYDEKVMAAGIETEVPSTNKVKHITIAVNRKGGGKPFHSNQLTDWQPTAPLKLEGIIEVCH